MKTNYTPTLEEHLATLTMRELRRYQSIVQAQIPMAYAQRNAQALEKLQEMDYATIAAIHKLAFGA